MTHVEQLHLEAIESNVYIRQEYGEDRQDDNSSIANISKAASKSAEITEQISCEFAEWLDDNSYWWNWYYKKFTKYRKILPIAESDLKTTKELFQEYLKSKENEIQTNQQDNT